MADDRWNVPQTETGLQTLLMRLDESRAAGDEAAVGHGLLALAWLVKWVRSDNHEPPFVRALTLTNEAIEIFRRIGDKRGLLAALQETSAFLPPEEADRRHEEATRLAESLGDELAKARTLAARSRSMGLRDRAEAARLAREALEIFVRHGAKKPAAAALLSLAIQLEEPREKHGAGLESARLYRESGDPKHAAYSMSVAIMYGEEFLLWPDMESMVRQGLADAIAGVDQGREAAFYGHLAKVAATKGDAEEATDCLRRQKSLQENDGLTPAERLKQDVAMTKTLIAMSRAAGNDEGVALFEEELRRLRRRKRKNDA